MKNTINFEAERSVSNDFVISWNNQKFQLLEKQAINIYPRMKLKVQRRLDQSIHIFYDNEELAFEKIVDKDEFSVYNTDVRGHFKIGLNRDISILV